MIFSLFLIISMCVKGNFGKGDNLHGSYGEKKESNDDVKSLLR